MFNNFIPTEVSVSILFVLLVTFFIIQRIRYRKMLKKKNYDIFFKIKEQSRLEKELERSKIEKEILEKILNNKVKIYLEVAPDTNQG